MFLPPLFRQFPFKRPLQNRLPVDFQLLLGDAEVFHAFVQFAEQFLKLGDDTVLFGEGGEWKIKGAQIFSRYPLSRCPAFQFINI